MTWSPVGGRAVLALFTVEAARALFGIKPADVHDRFVTAHEVLDRSCWPLLDALKAAPSADAALDALERALANRWKSLQAEPDAVTSLWQIGHHWLGKLAWQARQWERSCSPRQVERRIKSLSGRSLREWGTLLKAEGAFFSGRERYEAGQPLDWADLAQDQGFTDQSHLVRAVKRVTGFTPTAFVERYLEDESFWLYRLWV
jgi:AraC-like DNA-binding protein